jgi:Ca2+:H+ antiporter
MGVESLEFSKILTNIMSSLILVASVSLIVPTTMSPLTQPSDQDLTTLTSENNILILSRTTAILLLILFSIYVYFQMKTHTYLFLFLDPPEDESAATPIDRRESTLSEDGHVPTLSLWAAGSVLLASTICLTLCINYLINTTDGLAKSESVPISKIFIGMVLIPIAGNIGKCVVLVAISRKKKIDLAIRTILNSVLQISLLILPLLILLGWVIGQPMMLYFDVFEAAVFLLAIIVVSYVVQDGKTNYFEGIMLIGTYVNCFSHLPGIQRQLTSSCRYIVVVVAFYIRPDAIERNMVLKP